MRISPGPASRLITALLALNFLALGAGECVADNNPEFPDISKLSGKTATPTVSVSAPVVSTPTNTQSAELTGFWDKLKTGSLDPACKKAQVNIKQNVTFASDVIGVGGSLRRALRKFPDGNIALVDEIGINTSLSLGHELASLSDVGSLSIGLTSRLEGKSQVVRPVHSDRFCGEALQWVKFYEMKTVVPPNAKRISKMAVGEIWKLPLTMSVGFSVSAGAVVGDVVTLSFSAGSSRESRPSVTLRRLAEDKLRLRLRLDRIVVKSVGFSASTVEIPLDALGLSQAGAVTADFLVKGTPAAARKFVTAEVFNNLIQDQINKFLTVKFSFAHSRFSGKKLLIEFILDPNDQEQMANLQQFLTGDFGFLRRFFEMGLKFNRFTENDDAIYGLDAINDAADQAGEDLGAQSSYAGTDMYHGNATNTKISLPIIGTYGVTKGSSYHRYQSSVNGGETVHLYERTREYNGSGLEIPFKGALTKHNYKKDVMVLNRESTDGKVSNPVLLYQQYEGIAGKGHGAVEDMLEKANGMLRYVGANGGSTEGASQLPVSDIVNTSTRYTAGVMGVKLLISDKGLQDIMFAPPQTIMKAYMNVMREAYADVVDKVMGLFYFDKKGKVAYNETAVRAALGIGYDEDASSSTNPLNIVNTLAYTATRLIMDIAGVKDAPDAKSRSEKLADVASGKSKSDIGYEDFFKVVLQMVKPSDVSASVYVHLDAKDKDVKPVTNTYTFYEDRSKPADATLNDVTELRERYADPTDLSD